jgi:hypothetical protein
MRVEFNHELSHLFMKGRVHKMSSQFLESNFERVLGGQSKDCFY